MKKDILTLLDLAREDFEYLIQRALKLKENFKTGIVDRHLKGKTLGLVFDKPSTRTRVAFETAMVQMGGTPLFINPSDTQMTRNEPVRDTARVFSGYLDVLAIRTYSQDLLNEFAEFTEIPVINALTDRYHPCQIFSDLMTLTEIKGSYKDLKIAWTGDGNNVLHSWLNAAAVLDLNIVLACPKGYFPKRSILENAKELSAGHIELTTNPVEAVTDADVVYTDAWVSMGQENELVSRKRVFTPFKVNQPLLKHAKADAVVMHGLPAHRGNEITDEVLEGKQSVVWAQSENKMHMNKAVLEVLINGKL